MDMFRELILVSKSHSEENFQEVLRSRIPEEFDFDYTTFAFNEMDECEINDFVDLLGVFIDCRRDLLNVGTQIESIIERFLGTETYLVIESEKYSKEEILLIEKFCSETSFLGGVLDLSANRHFQLPFFRELTRKISHGELKKLDDRLERLGRRTTLDLLKVRKMHSLLLPRRVENYWNYRVFSKYAVGKNLGGEFFDGIKTDQSVYIVLSSTDSYNINSALINVLIDFKTGEAKVEDNLKDFCSKLFSYVAETQKVEMGEFGSLTIVRLTPSQSERVVEFVNWGKCQIFSEELGVIGRGNSFAAGMEDFELAYSRIEMGQTKRLLILSEGFQDNYLLSKSATNLDEDVKAFYKSRTIDLLNEAFIALPQAGADQFQDYDSTGIIIEDFSS